MNDTAPLRALPACPTAAAAALAPSCTTSHTLEDPNSTTTPTGLFNPGLCGGSACTGLLGHPQKAEAARADAIAGRIGVAIRRPAVVGGAAPATAPKHAVPARRGAC